jgi:AcrR family transcriptional regulator
MRVRTEGRRQAIIEVAVDVFREVGFERASMDVISRRLGGSKGTLYGYFHSKEELYETAMRAAIEAPGDRIMNLLDPKPDNVRGVLERFTDAYLDFILGTEVLALSRTAVSEGANIPLGSHLFEQGPARAVTMFGKFFAEQIKRGRMRPVSPLAMSVHFKGLIESAFLESALYGAEPLMDRVAAVPSAVDAFLRAYATELLS